MSETKISEAVVSRACGAWLAESAKIRGGDHDCMRAALEAALAARQPVAVKESDYVDVPDIFESARQPGVLIAQKVGDYRVTVAEDTITVSHGRDVVFAYSAGDAEPIVARQPGAQEPVDFYVCDTCGHYYMENGVTCDCTALAKQPPLRHVRMVAAPPAQGDHPYQRITGLQGIGDAADYLARYPADDYAKRRLSERVAEFCQKHGVSPAQGIDLDGE